MNTILFKGYVTQAEKESMLVDLMLIFFDTLGESLGDIEW